MAIPSLAQEFRLLGEESSLGKDFESGSCTRVATTESDLQSENEKRSENTDDASVRISTVRIDSDKSFRSTRSTLSTANSLQNSLQNNLQNHLQTHHQQIPECSTTQQPNQQFTHQRLASKLKIATNQSLHLIRLITLSSNLHSQKNAAFFDEFGYNVIISQLLNNKSHFPNETIPEQSSLAKSSTFSSLVTSAYQKINVTKSSDKNYQIHLFDNYNIELYKCILSISQLQKSFSSSNQFTIFSLLISRLINLKKLVTNKLIYFMMLRKSAIRKFSQFVDCSRKIDNLLKKSVFSFKEYELYNQVDHRMGFGGATGGAFVGKSKLSAVLKSPEKACSVISYLHSTTLFFTNYYIINMAQTVYNFSESVHMSLHSMASLLSSYAVVHEVDIEQVSRAISVFEASKPQELGEIALKPLHLSHRRNLSLSSRSESVREFNSTSNKSLNGTLRDKLQEFEASVSDFNSVRKLFLLLWLIVTHERCDTAASANVVVDNIVSCLYKLGQETTTEPKFYITSSTMLSLYNEFEQCQKSFTDSYNFLCKYFQYSHLNALVKSSSSFAPPSNNKPGFTKDLYTNLHKVLSSINGDPEITEISLAKALSTFQDGLNQWRLESKKQRLSFPTDQRNVQAEQRYSLPFEPRYPGIDTALRSPPLTLVSPHNRQHSLSSIAADVKENVIVSPTSSLSVSPVMRNKRFSTGLQFSVLKAPSSQSSYSDPSGVNGLGISTITSANPELTDYTKYRESKVISDDVNDVEEIRLSKRELESELNDKFSKLVREYPQYENEDRNSNKTNKKSGRQTNDNSESGAFIDKMSFLNELQSTIPGNSETTDDNW